MPADLNHWAVLVGDYFIPFYGNERDLQAQMPACESTSTRPSIISLKPFEQTAHLIQLQNSPNGTANNRMHDAIKEQNNRDRDVRPLLLAGYTQERSSDLLHHISDCDYITLLFRRWKSYAGTTNLSDAAVAYLNILIKLSPENVKSLFRHTEF